MDEQPKERLPSADSRTRGHAGEILKIAHVTPYFWPVIGGITTYVDSIAKAQRRSGALVRIFARGAAPGIDVEVGPSNPFLFAQWVARRLHRWRPGVVHAHGEWSALAGSLARWGSSSHITVFTVHTDFRPTRNAVREFLLKILLRHADCITAMSPSSIEKLVTRFPALKSVELAPPGFRVLDELPDTQASLSKALGLESAFPKVCAVSMMVWPEKVEGLKLLIRSMPIIAQTFPSARLLIVGDGGLRPEIEKEIVASNARSLVVLAGTQANPAPFISLSDVFVHISFRDTFGQSLLEALSIGRASVVNHEVAQNLPARLAQEGVLAVAPLEVEVAEAVKRLGLNADLRERLGREGQRLVKESLGWDKVAREMLATYRGRASRGP